MTERESPKRNETQSPLEQITRREGLRRAAAMVFGTAAFGIAAAGCSKEQPVPAVAERHPSTTLEDWRAGYHSNQSRIMEREVAAFHRNLQIPQLVRDAQKDEKVRAVFDRARLMPQGTFDQGTPTINLQEIEKQHGVETRNKVAAVLQWSLNVVNQKLGEEIKKLDPAYWVDPSAITVDGDFQKLSHNARKLFHARLSKLHTLRFGSPTAQPHVMSAHDTGIGSQGTAALEYFNPQLALFTANTKGLPYAVIRESAEARASFGVVKVDEYTPMPKGPQALMVFYLGAGVVEHGLAGGLLRGAPGERQRALYQALGSGALGTSDMSELIRRHYQKVEPPGASF